MELFTSQMSVISEKRFEGGRSLANKETALAHLIGQNLDRQSKQNRMLGGRGSGLRSHAPLSWADAMKQASRLDMLNLSW